MEPIILSDVLAAALERLALAAEAYEADQSRAKDSPFVQPVSMEEAAELSAALTAAREILDQYRMILQSDESGLQV